MIVSEALFFLAICIHDARMFRTSVKTMRMPKDVRQERSMKCGSNLAGERTCCCELRSRPGGETWNFYIQCVGLIVVHLGSLIQPALLASAFIHCLTQTPESCVFKPSFG